MNTLIVLTSALMLAACTAYVYTADPGSDCEYVLLSTCTVGKNDAVEDEE